MASLVDLQRLGQSVWLDFISRDLLASGELARLVDAGLGGLTSNPAIFEKAIGQGQAYGAEIAALARAGRNPKQIYEALAIADIRAAADALRPVYERTRGADGYASLEVSPELAHDTSGTLAEARRLWGEVGRPNLMIKVPGTEAGAPAIRQLIAEGINVNVTLLFSQAAYQAVAEAYLAGLEARSAQGKAVAGIASVASFFISRIDTAVDAQLDRLAPKAADAAAVQALGGRAAIANARQAYRHYQGLAASPRWAALARAGAMPQRLLWASTSSKNPAYRDVLYVEELIGPHTVNTLPPATLEAFVDHGQAAVTITRGADEAAALLADLERYGVSLDQVTAELLRDGIRQFAEAFDKLLQAVSARAQGA